jgi:hypothetical protein
MKSSLRIYDAVECKREEVLAMILLFVLDLRDPLEGNPECSRSSVMVDGTIVERWLIGYDGDVSSMKSE